ncbi:MAG TPA: hypothetical protein ACHBX0_03060 [Arsenophonus sp.]
MKDEPQIYQLLEKEIQDYENTVRILFLVEKSIIINHLHHLGFEIDSEPLTSIMDKIENLQILFYYVVR